MPEQQIYSSQNYGTLIPFIPFERSTTCEFRYPIDCDKLNCTNEQMAITKIRMLDMAGLDRFQMFYTAR